MTVSPLNNNNRCYFTRCVVPVRPHNWVMITDIQLVKLKGVEENGNVEILDLYVWAYITSLAVYEHRSSPVSHTQHEAAWAF
jgi:hypothetical protein